MLSFLEFKCRRAQVQKFPIIQVFSRGEVFSSTPCESPGFPEPAPPKTIYIKIFNRELVLSLEIEERQFKFV